MNHLTFVSLVLFQTLLLTVLQPVVVVLEKYQLYHVDVTIARSFLKAIAVHIGYNSI